MPVFSFSLRALARFRLAAALAALSCALCLGSAPAARASDIVTDEKSVAVAETVFGILGYSRWPSGSPTVRLCVVGPTEYADELLKGGALPGERHVEVRRMRVDDNELLEQCDGVYVGMLGDAIWRQLRERLETHPLLSISERKELCLIGCMFCLAPTGSGVSFETNLDSVARSGVRVNPRVLLLARRKGGA